MPRVKLPNGQFAKFPDDMPYDQIKGIIQNKFPPKNAMVQEAMQNKSSYVPESVGDAFKSSLKMAYNAATLPIKTLHGLENSLASGILHGLENVAATPFEMAGKTLPRHDFNQMYGIENPNAIQKFAEYAGQGLPFGAATAFGGGIPAGIAGAAAYGFTQAEPGQHRVIDENLLGYGNEEGHTLGGRTRSAVEDALLAALTAGTFKAGSAGYKAISGTQYGKALIDKLKGFVPGKAPKPPKDFVEAEIGEMPGQGEMPYGIEAKFGQPKNIGGDYGRQAQFANSESQFTNPVNQPESDLTFLQHNEAAPVPEPMIPEPIAPYHGVESSEIPSQQQSIADSLYDYLSGGKNLNEAAIADAKHIADTFKNIKTEASEMYKPVFEHPNIVEKSFPELNLTKEQLKILRKDETAHIHKMSMVHKKNPTMQNTQELQTEIGAELGNMNKIRKMRGLTPDEQRRFGVLHEAQRHLRTNMENIVKREAPELEGQLGLATKNWREKVGKYYTDPDLYRIATGREINPKSSTFKSIFQNPEPEMQRVMADLGEQGQRSALLHGIGKAKGNYKPDLIKGLEDTLEERGLLPYFTPEFRGHIGNLKHHASMEENLINEITRMNKQTKGIQAENKSRSAKFEKMNAEHERKVAEHDQLIEGLKNLKPTAEQLPGYKDIKLSYPKAEIEAEKITKNLGGRHNELEKSIQKWMKESEKIKAAKAKHEAELAEHAAATTLAAAGTLMPHKSFLTAWKGSKIALGGLKKAGKVIKRISK